MPNNNTKTNEFILNFTMTDNQSGFLDEVKPTGILDVFQTIAGAHAETLGVSSNDLKKSGMCWVLESVRYKLLAKIPAHSQIIAKTSFLNPNKLFYERDYEIYDMSGNRLIIGTSRWFIIDYNTRKPVRSGVNYGCEGKSESIMGAQGKIRHNFENATTLGTYTVRRADIDVVGHMNNTRYADIIFEFYPNALSELQIDFIKECKYGDCVTVKAENEECYVLIEGSVNGERRFIARLKK